MAAYSTGNLFQVEPSPIACEIIPPEFTQTKAIERKEATIHDSK
jgi:hypothetical protein